MSMKACKCNLTTAGGSNVWFCNLNVQDQLKVSYIVIYTIRHDCVKYMSEISYGNTDPDL